MSCQWRNLDTGRFEDRSDVVIPYRSVLDFYFKETQYLKDSEQEQERLARKRKRGPVSEERKQALVKQLESARAAKVSNGGKVGVPTVDFIEKVT
jgi:hypothetical protein